MEYKLERNRWDSALTHSLLDTDQRLLPDDFLCLRNSTSQMTNLPWRRNRCYRKLMWAHRLNLQGFLRDYLFFSSLNVKALEILQEMNSFMGQSHQTREWGCAGLDHPPDRSQELETWDLNSPPVRPGGLWPEPQAKVSQPNSLAVSWCPHQHGFSKPQGWQSHCWSKMSMSLQAAGTWRFLLPFPYLFWGPTPHPLKRLWLHIPFNLAHSFRASYLTPHHPPSNHSAQFSAQLDQKKIWEVP